MFNRILIANRGEIACRIIRTCHRLGIASVAVYSQADADALHVRLADQAYCIGGAAPGESYLRGEAVIQAALDSGAQAIHPGYGFLSENADFAEAVAAAGLVFIGPRAESMRRMGSKAGAKQLMAQAGVPVVPGYNGEDQSLATLSREAARTGFPLMVKAAHGGGGKGMRVVHRLEDFVAALESCQREARNAFGRDRVLLERYVPTPRHIEIQVFGDAHGGAIHLNERECSAQRRYQKVLEESPSPFLTPQLRQAMGEAAVLAARAIDYVNAGTVEFIVDPDGAFYFMEINTRLQVEHPVTEVVTGLDLVEWQLPRKARGLPLAVLLHALGWPIRGGVALAHQLLRAEPHHLAERRVDVADAAFQIARTQPRDQRVLHRLAKGQRVGQVTFGLQAAAVVTHQHHHHGDQRNRHRGDQGREHVGEQTGCGVPGVHAQHQRAAGQVKQLLGGKHAGAPACSAQHRQARAIDLGK